jgi:hypothetical protein
VSVEKSRAEIESILVRYGAEQFQYGWDQSKAAIQFACHNRHVRFVLPIPDKSDKQFHYTQHKRHYSQSRVSPEKALANWEQACRQRWRALVLCIKAKLESVACKITTFEEEFLAHIVDPHSGKTIGQVLAPQLDASYGGESRPLMLTNDREGAV